MPILDLNEEELIRSEKLTEIIIKRIRAMPASALPFGDFMELALYQPNYGYYCAAPHTIGEKGDYITAPLIGSIFGDCIAKKIFQCFSVYDGPRQIYEFGAGDGTLAFQILNKLDQIGCQIDAYGIVEISPMLKSAQHQTIAALPAKLANKVRWHQRLPSSGMRAMVIANEVVDAMPVELFIAEKNRVLQGYVIETDNGLSTDFREQTTPDFASSFAELDLSNVEFPYSSELHCRTQAWMRTLAGCITDGSLIIVDYGFPQSEYYHHDRFGGTLTCHRRHQLTDNPLAYIGCQDITAHVNFSTIASIAKDCGMQLNGYASLGAFVFDSGILLEPQEFDNDAAKARYLYEVDMLTSPAQMGELFKVIELTKNYDSTIFGFETADRSHTLGSIAT